MKTLKEFDVNQKRVLVRCDFNVPLGDKGNILDDFRIRKTLPTISYLLENKAEVILMSHLDNPGGKFVKELTMAPVSAKVNDLLGKKVILLENLRFNPGEEKNDDDFAKELAQKGDIYVNDAFGVCHRSHASVSAITKYLPSCAGLLLEKEIEVLSNLLENPQKPLVVIIGGAKVETKSKLIEKFLTIADFVLVSGLIGKEIKEKNLRFSRPEKIVFPTGELGALDINNESIKIFQEKIIGAKTVFWNGPFGKFEEEEYAAGTRAIAQSVINSEAFSIVGGGETVEFLGKLGWRDKFSHVSTGGGAMLSFLSGEKLPGLEALE